MISLQCVTKRFAGGKTAVDALNLDVNAGEVFGYLGHNGAGKTTTLRMLVGLLAPDAGRVLVDNIDVAAHPLDVKRRIGFVPDNPDLYERLSGLEYLRFIADVFEVPEADRTERVLRLGDQLELTPDLNGRISVYSRGMRQKLAIMAALIHAPSVWILDEPMVGLDPKAAHALKGLMTAHARAGNTVLFSTHVLEVAERLCDRVAIIKQGKLIASGTVPELKALHGVDQSLEHIFLELTGS